MAKKKKTVWVTDKAKEDKAHPPIKVTHRTQEGVQIWFI
jgi:hypothetical protein